MHTHYPVIEEKSTPEYILAVLQDWHRQASHFDPEVDHTATLNFNTTVAQWREANDLLAWRELGRSLNEIFKINYSDEVWRAVLEPQKGKRLRDDCGLIAEQAPCPRIRAAKLLGAPCDTAGAFLTLRSILHDDGADVERLSPSTELAPYSRLHFKTLLLQTMRLAPGALPEVRVRTPIYDFFVFGFFIALVIFCIAVALQALLLMLGAAAVGLILYLGISSAARLHPHSVTFGDLKTFRDLSSALVKTNELNDENRSK